MPIPTTAVPYSDPNRWGRAARFAFDDPSKWVTEADVPLLQEHALENDDGKEIGYVDKSVLEEIAQNNNRRVVETGDPAPLIIGHTSDDPTAPEKPVRGFAVNYRVKPYKRDDKTGQLIHAIYADLKARPKHAKVLEDFPRRSVELWLNKKEIDPIAVLGGTTPQQDLGVVLRHARLKNVSVLGGSTPQQDLGPTLRYDRRSGGTVFQFAMEGKKMPCPPGMNGHGRYAAGDFGEDDGLDEGDTAADGMDDGMGDGGPMGDDDGHPDMSEGDFGDGGDPSQDDPTVAKVLASKPIKDLMAKVDEILAALTGAGEGGGGGMGAAPPAGGGMPPEEDDGMGAPGGGGPEEDAAMYHDEPPVRFDASGMAGPGSAYIPATGTTGKRYARPQNGKQPQRSVPMNRNGAAATGRPQPGASPEVIRMKRQLQAMHLKLARAEAEKTIEELSALGYVFADKAREAETLAVMGDEDRKFYVEEVIKKNYKRQESNPGRSTYPGLARYARAEVGEEDEYAPQTPEEAMMFADLQSVKKMSVQEAVKYMRTKGQPHGRNGTPRV